MKTTTTTQMPTTESSRRKWAGWSYQWQTSDGRLHYCHNLFVRKEVGQVVHWAGQLATITKREPSGLWSYEVVTDAGQIITIENYDLRFEVGERFPRGFGGATGGRAVTITKAWPSATEAQKAPHPTSRRPSPAKTAGRKKTARTARRHSG